MLKALTISVALALGVLAAGSGWNAISPRAAHACPTPSRSATAGYYFDGWSQFGDGSAVGGVYSQIENVSVDLQAGGGPTTAWVMLSNGPGDKWAQVGWLKNSSGNRYTMMQVRNSASDITTRDSADAPQPVGSYPYYTALYNNTPGKFTFQVAGANWPWSGYTVNAGFTPTTALIFGETQNLNSQMPGTTSDSAGFYDGHYYHYGYWTEFAGTAYTILYPSYFAKDGPYYNTTYYIWDKGC